MRQLLALPNLLTLARLACIPPLVWLTCADSTPELLWAVGIFAFAVVTDWADGYVARVWGPATRLGTLLDQAVDKMLVLSILLVAVQRELLPLWLVLINLFREFMVSDFRRLAAARHRTVGANWMGKTKFVLQVVLVAMVYAHLIARAAGRPVPGGEGIIYWSAVALTALSCAFAARFFWLQRAPGTSED